MQHYPTRARQIDGAVNGLEVDIYGNAKKPTWAWFQGVKTVVDDIQDIPGTLAANGLDFEYGTRALYRKIDEPMISNGDVFEESKLRREVVAIHPGNKVYPLHAHVSTRHKFLGHQPEDLVRFFAALARQHPMSFESLLVLDKGRTIFAAAKAYECKTTMFDTEIIEPYVCFSTGVDRASHLWFEIVLPSCMNAIPNYINKRSAYRFTHHRALALEDMLDQFTLESTANIQLDITNMVKRYVSREDRRRYFGRILWDNRATLYQAKIAGESAPHAPDAMTEEKYAKYNREIDELEHWYSHGAGQDQQCRSGNVWGALNAVLFWTDHAKRSRDVADTRARTNSILQGPLQAIKRSAITRAQALAA